MIDTKDVIDGLLDINKRLGFEYRAIDGAIKVCKMWQQLKKDSCEHGLIAMLEEEFFPSIIHQTVTVKIQGKDREELRKTRQHIKTTWGVMEVKEEEC